MQRQSEQSTVPASTTTSIPDQHSICWRTSRLPVWADWYLLISVHWHEQLQQWRTVWLNQEHRKSGNHPNQLVVYVYAPKWDQNARGYHLHKSVQLSAADIPMRTTEFSIWALIKCVIWDCQKHNFSYLKALFDLAKYTDWSSQMRELGSVVIWHRRHRVVFIFIEWQNNKLRCPHIQKKPIYHVMAQV